MLKEVFFKAIKGHKAIGTTILSKPITSLKANSTKHSLVPSLSERVMFGPRPCSIKLRLHQARGLRPDRDEARESCSDRVQKDGPGPNRRVAHGCTHIGSEGRSKGNQDENDSKRFLSCRPILDALVIQMKHG